MQMGKITDEYDIGEAFAAIENELIASMMRNISRHKAWEKKENKEWTMWQVEQLKEFEKFKKENQAKYPQVFKDLNRKIEELLRMAEEEGQMDQEAEILQAIKDGFPAREVEPGTTAEFFKLNNRKLEALIQATNNDMQKAETAVLRMAEDQYRKIIYNAQVYANTGAGTYEKAVDMATRDFLEAGLNCIEYKNGSRHTLSDYADMAIRTASKRAYLQGEGAKRQEWGISTVIINKRGDNPCPKCLPFVGKVMIDDVWSNGPKDGKSPVTGKQYPLISSAIAAGLYHPRCRDSHTTYFEGISTPPNGKFSKKELNDLAEQNLRETRQQYADRQAEKYERLEKYSLDSENKKQYAAKVDEWAGAIKTEFSPATTIEEAQQFAEKFCQESFLDKTFKGRVDYKGISLENANGINQALSEIYDTYDLPKINGIKAIDPKSAKGKKIFAEDAVAAYSPVEHGIYVNKAILKKEKTLTEYNRRSKEAWDYVMDNIDTLSGSQKEMAERYKAAGRSLVGDGSAKDYITHEIGHHVQWEAFDARTNNQIGAKMQQYAGKISGYATASKSEYFAESFAAYIKGERKLIDPDFTVFLDAKMKGFHRRAEKSIVKTFDSDIMISGARITDIFSKEADDFAEMYYKEIRSFSTDAKKIADNLGKKESDIKKIKAYLFENESLYDSETKSYRRFDPDCAIAQSWQRLMAGKDIKQHDQTLIEHELLEMKIKQEHPEMEHWKAHELAAKEYNYQKEAMEYYGNLKKYKKDK